MLFLSQPDTTLSTHEAAEEDEEEVAGDEGIDTWPNSLADGLDAVAEAEAESADQGDAQSGRSKSSATSSSSSSTSSSSDSDVIAEYEPTVPNTDGPIPGSEAASSREAPVVAAMPVGDREWHDSLIIRREERGDVLGHIKHVPQQAAFYAKCPLHAGKCIKTQTYRESARRKGSGRPLGFLAGWLHEAHKYENKQQHMKADVPFEVRLRARQLLMREWNSAEFLEHERGRANDEAELEPRVVPR